MSYKNKTVQKFMKKAQAEGFWQVVLILLALAFLAWVLVSSFILKDQSFSLIDKITGAFH